jgi:hypothetical protein
MRDALDINLQPRKVSSGFLRDALLHPVRQEHAEYELLFSFGMDGHDFRALP